MLINLWASTGKRRAISNCAIWGQRAEVCRQLERVIQEISEDGERERLQRWRHSEQQVKPVVSSPRHQTGTNLNCEESSYIGPSVSPSHKIIDRYWAVSFFLLFIMKYDHRLSQHAAAHTAHLRAQGSLWREPSSHSHEPIHHTSHKATLSPSITPSEGGLALIAGKLQKQQASTSISLQLQAHKSLSTSISWDVGLRGHKPSACNRFCMCCYQDPQISVYLVRTVMLNQLFIFIFFYF